MVAQPVYPFLQETIRRKQIVKSDNRLIDRSHEAKGAATRVAAFPMWLSQSAFRTRPCPPGLSPILILIATAISSAEAAMTMDHSTTPKQKAKITAGAVAALVIIGWIAILAIAVLATR